ncbi:hypothetical protein, partial [Citrobacter youngae]|uniref:hypothetical protein n=1 Tax=Citrobacter youngae TaxID=133448 RepID=UPI0019530C33
SSLSSIALAMGSAMYLKGNFYVTDMFEGKFVELTPSGKRKREILLGGDPTVFLYHNGVFLE